ncbi:MAG: hypothetical protein IT579_11980 [Verrucomicrobia subdivision 3 bacterium]|nr:hypothetical protein [Limisphaerales bacterium]
MNMLRHPSKPELLAYAEGLLAGQGISAATARHIAACASCAQEVAAIRKSFEFTQAAGDLDPSDDLTRTILIAARRERQAPKRMHGRAWFLTVKGFAYVACVALVASVYFQFALGDRTTEPGPAMQTVAQERPMAALPSPEELRKATEEIRALAAAVGVRPGAPDTVREWRQTRAVLALNADLSAARAALDRNPGCERASRVITTNLRRQAQALKSLYVERCL